MIPADLKNMRVHTRMPVLLCMSVRVSACTHPQVHVRMRGGQGTNSGVTP